MLSYVQVQAEAHKADFETERKCRERAQSLLAGFKNKISSAKMYEKAIIDLEQELHAVNQNWMDTKKKLSEAEVELKKCNSCSFVPVLEHFKTNIEKITVEKEHYYQEYELTKSLLSDMGNVLRREIDNKAKEITSLHTTVKKFKREIIKAGHEV